MSASNFHRGATSKVFAVLMDREETFKECPECGEIHNKYTYSEEDFNNLVCCEVDLVEQTEYVSAESYEYDDFKEYLRETAQEEIKNRKGICFKEESGSNNDRNYCATNLFSYSTSKMFGDIEISVKVIGQIVGAYYEGASLDFVIEFNGEENEEPNFYWDFDNSDMNRGLQVLQNKNAIKWAEKTKTELIELIEEVFTKVSQPLNVLGTASNGETFYEKV